MATAHMAGKGSVTIWNHVRAIALLPMTNTVVIPALIVASTGDADFSWLEPRPLAALSAVGGVLLLGAGALLVARSIGLFARVGEGTLAPWDPTRVLVIDGVYRFCRNPMKTGLFLILLAESVLLRSAALAAWLALFALVNAVYIRVSEEPGLRARFGDEYDAYCATVPRWLPRLRAAPRRIAQAGESR